MPATPILSFDFEDEAVRVIDRAGEPWFVATDVCRVLGIRNVTQAIERLEESGRSMLNIGRQGATNLISEAGLYTIILRSDAAMKPGTIAYRFRHWVTGDLLPTLRRTGSYGVAGRRSAEQLEHSDRTARRRELPGLLDRLERERTPEKRRVLHALVVRACEAEGIEPPAIDAIGAARPAPPDIVGGFFAALGALDAAGVAWNHSRNPDVVAVRMSDIAQLLSQHRQPVAVTPDLRRALRQSPRFVDAKSVNSALTGTILHAWVFLA